MRLSYACGIVQDRVRIRAVETLGTLEAPFDEYGRWPLRRLDDVLGDGLHDLVGELAHLGAEVSRSGFLAHDVGGIGERLAANPDRLGARLAYNVLLGLRERQGGADGGAQGGAKG